MVISCTVLGHVLVSYTFSLFSFSCIYFHRINKDWASRSANKQGNYKRVERKTKPAETHTDNDNIWKSKRPQVPPTLPRGAGPGPLGRSGAQSGGFSTQASSKKDVQHNNYNRLQLLAYLAQTQPSAMVWGKSWKYNKSLPSPAEGTARSDWGQCWMFATQQPQSEEGKPWPNGPNMTDPCSLHLWKKPERNVEDSLELNVDLPTEEWHMSWKKPSSHKKEDTSSINGNKSGYFALMLETQQLNEALCSSEWSESWKCTKHQSEKGHVVPDGGLTDEYVDKQDKRKEMSSRWEECWRLVNHHGCSQVQTSESPECANWTAAMVIFNKHSDPSMKEHPDNVHNDFSEWGTSWQVTKNMSKPCEEIEKVLKAVPPKMEIEPEKPEAKPKGHHSPSKEEDHIYEQLKHDVIYWPKKLPLLKHVENKLLSSDWHESWKTLKNILKMERRRVRPFRMSEYRIDVMSTNSEWKDSWKFTCPSQLQDPEHWQQDWATTPQVGEHRTRAENNLQELDGSWEKSWRFLRGQHRSELGQGHHSDDSSVQKKHVRSVADWQAAWSVSESQFHHDKPSLMQWREAWKWSVFHTERWFEKMIRDNRLENSMEIQPLKEKIYLQTAKAKMIQSFVNHTVTENHPEENWRDSWKAGSLLNHQTHHHESHGKKINSTTQQVHPIANEHGCKWGRSFRIANPMPHVEQPWVESSPNPCHYTVMRSRESNIHNRINTSFSDNPAVLKLWGNSHQFMQDAGAKSKGMGSTKAPADPRVILTKTKMKRNLYGNINMDKQSERKWAGCHLLGKTQPRPKRGAPSGKKLMLEDDETKAKFFEEWAESWKLLINPRSLKKIPMKSLVGWAESWKFLLPPYQPMNVSKAR